MKSQVGRDGSAVENTFWSSRRLESDSQHPLEHLTLLLLQLWGPSRCLHTHVGAHHIQTHVIYTVLKSLKNEVGIFEKG